MNVQKIVSRWNALNMLQRAGLLTVLIVLGIVLGGSLYFSDGAGVPLYASSLDAGQMNEVDGRLAAWNIPHTIKNDGILVSARSRNEILLRLSLAGLPHSRLTTMSETLAKAGALTPDAVLQAETRIGLAGDLAAALRSIDGIADAGVVLAPAVHGTFADDPSFQASAAVRLSLRPGIALSVAVTNGIRSFVAAAVPGLTRERVTILDDRGIALETSATGQDAAELLRQSMQSAFDEAFGSGATIVRVHITQDPSTHVVHDTRRLPIGGPVFQEQRKDELLHESQRSYEERESTIQRGELMQDSQTSTPGGQITHVTVAVLLDEERHINAERVRDIAKATAGINTADGDVVLVAPVHFAHIEVARTSGLPSFEALAPSMISLAGILAVGLAAKSLLPLAHELLRRLIDRRTAARLDSLVDNWSPHQVHRALQGEPPHTAAAIIRGLPTPTAAQVLDLYSPHERHAIIERLSRKASVYAPDLTSVMHGR